MWDPQLTTKPKSVEECQCLLEYRSVGILPKRGKWWSPRRSNLLPCRREAAPVRCAGCRWILTVAPGMTEFSCPKCQLPQILPPELMSHIGVRRPPLQAQGVDPTKIQLPCARCQAILNVPYGLSPFKCPQCDVDLAVDLSKFQKYSSEAANFNLPPGMLPLEIS